MSDLNARRHEMPPSLFELLEVDIEARAKSAAPAWVSEIAQIVEAAVDEWAAEHVAPNSDIDQERWANVYRPAMLWRYYTHLARELNGIAEGHETVFFNAVREDG